MNAFLSMIFIENTIAEYEIVQMGIKFKAILLSSDSSKQLPVQITFWKESGRWKSLHSISDHVLYQFGNNIDNHILNSMVYELKNKAA